MTREEAIKVLGDVSAYLASRASLENESLAGHTFTDICRAIKVLRQEPCEDCISRADVLELIEDINDTVFGQVVSKGIMKLPSVRPKEKVGHWITEYDRWGDIVTTISHYQCSECKQYDYDKDNYCPYCGAKMFEPKESEEEE